MKVLLLSPSPEKLLPCINSIDDEFVLLNTKINQRFIVDSKIDLLISYNYRRIIELEVLQVPGLRAFNLHTSLLPFNRGSHPILWSILESTPLGITIHEIDQGLDTGPIIFQREIQLLDQSKSLKELHEDINKALIELFCSNWKTLREGSYTRTPQAEAGTYHRSIVGNEFISTLDKSWDTCIRDVGALYSDYLSKKKKREF
jgi:methionyl-tRNA formyltransferase